MKKLLIALPIVAGTSWAGTSYFAGVQSESAYDKLISQTEVMKAFTFEKESFDKGLTNSNAVTAVKESNNPDAEILFRLKHEINHSSVQLDDNGPALGTATIRTTLVEGSIHAKYKNARDYFTADEPIEIITKAGISGNLTNTITISPAEVSLKNDTETMAIAETVFNVLSNNTRTSGEGTIGAIELNDGKGNVITASPSELNFDVANRHPWVSDYEFLMSMATLTVEAPDLDAPLQADGLHVTTSSTLSDDELDYLGALEIEQIDLGAMFPANNQPLTSGRLEVAVNNMQAQALRDFYEYYGQFSLTQRVNLSEELSAEFLNEYAKLATKDSEIIYDLDLENTEGVANADLSIRFIGDDSVTGRDNIVTGADLGNAIEIDADVVMDKAALSLTPAIFMMRSPPAQIAFVDNGDQFVSKATVRKLVADVNGTLYPLEDLSGGMLALPLEALIKGPGF